LISSSSLDFRVFKGVILTVIAAQTIQPSDLTTEHILIPVVIIYFSLCIAGSCSVRRENTSIKWKIQPKKNVSTWQKRLVAISKINKLTGEKNKLFFSLSSMWGKLSVTLISIPFNLLDSLNTSV